MKDKLRSPETAERYREARAKRGPDYPCPLCSTPPVTEFEHWKVIPNGFPYDMIATEHDMLVPKRHVNENALAPEEQEEFALIKATFAQKYSYLIEITTHGRSIPDHFHLHLVVGKVIPGSDAAADPRT